MRHLRTHLVAALSGLREVATSPTTASKHDATAMQQTRMVWNAMRRCWHVSYCPALHSCFIVAPPAWRRSLEIFDALVPPASLLDDSRRVPLLVVADWHRSSRRATSISWSCDWRCLLSMRLASSRNRLASHVATPFSLPVVMDQTTGRAKAHHLRLPLAACRPSTHLKGLPAREDPREHRLGRPLPYRRIVVRCVAGGRQCCQPWKTSRQHRSSIGHMLTTCG